VPQWGLEAVTSGCASARRAIHYLTLGPAVGHFRTYRPRIRFCLSDPNAVGNPSFMATQALVKSVDIRNRRASFEYAFLEEYTAGLALTGTEIKSIRQGKVNLQDAYCLFLNDGLYVRQMNISKYSEGTHYNHDPLRDRKLLLKKKELNRLTEKLKDQGLTIVPIKLFTNDRGFAKLQIALAKGKKLYDKRDSIKERDVAREMDRERA
jgi:SsrA-binding protein